MVSLSRQERLPDLYKVLDVPPTADSDRIRQSYMRHALRSHPDLMCNASKQSIESARAHFALLNQAYFTLSDPHRRAVYDEELAWQRERIEAIEYSFDLCASPVHADSVRSSPSILSTLQNAVQVYFGVNPIVTHIFDEVFEPIIAAEMEAMAKEAGVNVLPGTAGSTWSAAGLVSGVIVGFMVANIPGAAFGGVAGLKIGMVRDRTGVPVMQAFYNMSPEQRGAVLRRVAGRSLDKLYQRDQAKPVAGDQP